MREIPLFAQIQTDPTRSARELQVFWAACELLDFVDFRILTGVMLETQLILNQRRAHHASPQEYSRSTIASALKSLVEHGYLIRRREPDGSDRYRVPLSRVRADETFETSARARAPRSRMVGVLSEAVSAE